MSDTIEVSIDGESREIKMSFGLLNELSRKIGDLDAIPMLAIDPDLRESVLISLLSKRDKKGKITEEFSFFEAGLTVEDVSNLIDWAGGHVADFFLTSLEKGKALIADREARLKALLPSSNGSGV